jgi:hypothetical protein
MDKSSSFWKNYGYLFAAIPWVFFAVFYGSETMSKTSASLGALLLIGILNLKELKKGFILPWGTAVFFFLLALNDAFNLWPWADEHLFILINGALAAIIIFSMIIKKPFTLQYAKEQFPSQFWHEARFIKINWTLTGIWAILMSIMAVASTWIAWQSLPIFYNYYVSGPCMIIGVICNRVIPAHAGH